MRTSLRALAALGSAAALAFAVLPGTPAFASGQQSSSCRPKNHTCHTASIGVISPGNPSTIHLATSGTNGSWNCLQLKDNNSGTWVYNVNCTQWTNADQSVWVPGLSGTSYTAYLTAGIDIGTLYVANY
jgi:hypothetical protein